MLWEYNLQMKSGASGVIREHHKTFKNAGLDTSLITNIFYDCFMSKTKGYFTQMFDSIWRTQNMVYETF